MNRKVLFFTVVSSLLLGTLLFASVQVLTVEALIPDIVSISFREVESTLWLDVAISHQPLPPISSSHYVTTVELEINGAGTDLTQTPQSTTTFTVQHNLGPNTNTYSVRARALCTPHGYGGWSTTTTYPTPSPTPTLMPTPTPTLMPTPTPTLMPTPTPTPSNGPTPTHTPPPSPYSPSPSPSPTPSPEPTTPPLGFMPQEALYAIVIVAVGIVVVAIILILKKQKK